MDFVCFYSHFFIKTQVQKFILLVMKESNNDNNKKRNQTIQRKSISHKYMKGLSMSFLMLKNVHHKKRNNNEWTLYTEILISSKG